MEENLASATADSVSASALWSQEKEFWDSKVDTNSGPRTREAQHFRLVHWASSLLKERDEVRAQLALSPPAEESIIIRQELDLLVSPGSICINFVLFIFVLDGLKKFLLL